jgi:predicted TIM-barrel fold metal-dependent hydrolase
MASPLTRRTFLRHASALAAATAAPSLCRADDAAPPIIDTHQHLWDLQRFRLPWLDGAGGVLNKTHTTDDYAKAAEGLNVVKAVYMEVAVAAEQRAREAESVIDLCRRKVGVTVAAVIAGAPESAEFGQYIAPFQDSPYVKGVRSSFDAGVAGEHFVKNLRRLGELGLGYDINTGPTGLERAAGVVRECPDTRFVLDHCGNVDASVYRKSATGAAAETRGRWERGVSMLAERDRIVCKISGVMEAASSGAAGPDEYAAVVGFCLDRFGPDRVIFASNWPVVNRGGSFARWVEVVRGVTRGRTEIERRKLFHDNAMRFYGLD